MIEVLMKKIAKDGTGKGGLTGGPVVPWAPGFP